MKTISFFVPGTPKPQPRSRSFVLRGRGGAPILKNGQPILRVHDPGTAENWKAQIAEAAKPFIPFDIPIYRETNEDGTTNAIHVAVDFLFERPKHHFKSNGRDLKAWAPFWNTSRMDCDNLAKAVLDCLTTIGFWSDDGIVSMLYVSKRYCSVGEQSGCMVNVGIMDPKTGWQHHPRQTSLKI